MVGTDMIFQDSKPFIEFALAERLLLKEARSFQNFNQGIHILLDYWGNRNSVVNY